jgi:methylmalonyl-CoA mutase
LAGVVLEAWTDADALAAADALLALWDERLADPAQALGSLGLDPVGTQARTGGPASDITGPLARAQRIVGRPGVTAFVADGRPVHEAGGSDADELGYVLAVGAAYLRALLAAGVPVDQACSAIELRVVATADQFATIAKLRAARRTWARITEVAGASDAARAPKLHAITSWSMTSRRDPWVNLLRTTVAAFASGTAGADAVTVLPFDAAIGRSDAFARRLARNIQALLIDEANLARVIDPAGGAWFVEALTDDLADVAWTWFRELEGAGGITAALADGLVDERCAASRAVRADAIAHRRDPLTGVSEFPDVHESPVEREADAVPPSGGLPRVRYAEGFEHLRDASDAAAAAGHTPTVHLVALGTVADSTARATFAKNFFEAGGVRTQLHTVTAADAGATDVPTGATVCLCSSDSVYAEVAAEVARTLKESGASRVLLAGKPRERDALHSAGVDEFIHVGVDVLDVLERTLTHLGVRL